VLPAEVGSNCRVDGKLVRGAVRLNVAVRSPALSRRHRCFGIRRVIEQTGKSALALRCRQEDCIEVEASVASRRKLPGARFVGGGLASAISPAPGNGERHQAEFAASAARVATLLPAKASTLCAVFSVAAKLVFRQEHGKAAALGRSSAICVLWLRYRGDFPVAAFPLPDATCSLRFQDGGEQYLRSPDSVCPWRLHGARFVAACRRAWGDRESGTAVSSGFHSCAVSFRLDSHALHSSKAYVSSRSWPRQ
jgi:hypothetical protein